MPQPLPVLNRQRIALRALAVPTLAGITKKLSLAVSDKRNGESHVEALVDAARVEEALGLLDADDLKIICRAVGLDGSGKQKAIATRLGQWIETGDTSVGVRAESARTPAGKKRGKAATSEALPLGDVAAEYRHDDTRKNNPPAGLVEFDKPPAHKKRDYTYDPHLDPHLEWAGKVEHSSFEVDTVSLHIHERVSTQAILRAVRREDVKPQLNLFARPELPPGKEVDFYSHDVGWSNRLVLGDSLLVMNSLLERENVAGQVQCIYFDPPYGVRFNSNFQPSLSRRDVKDGDDESMTREPEQVQAYRDTWSLGIHSYLTYIRDRLLLARELLSESGSIFVQISEDNLHLVTQVLSEVFGGENFVRLVAVVKTSGLATADSLASSCDYLVWFCKDRTRLKYRQLFTWRHDDPAALEPYSRVQLADGTRRALTSEERRTGAVPAGARRYQLDNLTKPGPGSRYSVSFEGANFTAGSRWWGTTHEGMNRLIRAGRIERSGDMIRFVRFADDFPLVPLNALWADTGVGSAMEKIYVVQTSTKIVARCILMSTDPGDLVFDPTCGSGTTAVTAEQWGRRWITCDTSRVALSLARTRILTARFPYYSLRGRHVRDGFVYRRVGRVTMGQIAQNDALDGLTARAEIESRIRESGDVEVLYDAPEEISSKVRVSGPFTVEAVPLASMEDPSRDVDGPVSKSAALPGHFSDETSQYLSMMMDLLRQTGVNFPGNKKLRLPSLRPVKGNYEWFHAEGSSDAEGDPRRFAVSFGPRHGPVTTTQVIQAIKEARGFDVLLFTGFACDPEARKMIDQGMHGTELLFANAAPDILVGDLLKKKRTDQLFAVYGAPDVVVHAENGGSLVSVELVGVDLYDPNTGETRSAKGTDAAALFVDHDYDGKSFCISQALFPGGNNPWEKLQKALKGQIDEEKFAALQSTRSLPFKPGNKVAVKVIDDRGNEVIKIVDARKALKK